MLGFCATVTFDCSQESTVLAKVFFNLMARLACVCVCVCVSVGLLLLPFGCMSVLSFTARHSSTVALGRFFYKVHAYVKNFITKLRSRRSGGLVVFGSFSVRSAVIIY